MYIHIYIYIIYVIYRRVKKTYMIKKMKWAAGEIEVSYM